MRTRESYIQQRDKMLALDPDYYRNLSLKAKKKRGGLNSAKPFTRKSGSEAAKKSWIKKG